MHVLRITLFTTPGDFLSTVVRESDIVSFGEALGGVPPQLFATHEVFDMPDSGIEDATMEAMQRLGERIEREKNMAVSFFWHSMYFHRTQAGGTIANTLPSPLSLDEIRQVFIALAKHPAYDRHTVISFSEDNEIIELREGEVKIHGNRDPD